MRKYHSVLLFLLIGVMTFLLGGNEKSESTVHSVEPPVLTEPPALTVHTWNGSITALRGTSSWLYAKGDGVWSGMECDSMLPLQAQKYLPRFSLPPSSQNPVEAVLQFGTIPDEVRVRCWSAAYWDIITAESEDLSVTDNTIELKDGGYIYEIIANWNNSLWYGGTASYSFYAAPAGDS